MSYKRKGTTQYKKRDIVKFDGLISVPDISNLTGKTEKYVNLYFNKHHIEADFHYGQKAFYLEIDILPILSLIKLSTNNYNKITS
jgi:hypothetical protein